MPSSPRPVCLLAGFAAAGAQDAQSYPNKPVRIFVPYGAGGVADVTMRLLGQKLGEKRGQQVVIENRPGAGGVLSAQQALLASPAGRLFDVGDRQRHGHRHDAVQDPPL